MSTRTIWTVLKARLDGSDREPTILAAYEHEVDAIDRIDRIRAYNERYPMRSVGYYEWILGPEEDEGLFGNTPYIFWLRQTTLHS